MPHVRVLINKDNKKVITWFKRNKTLLRNNIAAASGYDVKDIAVIGELLDPRLCDNILDFEILFLTGKKNIDNRDRVASSILQRVRGGGMDEILPNKGTWGVWVKPNADTCYLGSSGLAPD